MKLTLEELGLITDILDTTQTDDNEVNSKLQIIVRKLNAVLQNKLVKKPKRYSHLSCTNEFGSFTFDWQEHCEQQPAFEEIWEDDNGDCFVIYKSLTGDVVGHFENED